VFAEYLADVTAAGERIKRLEAALRRYVEARLGKGYVALTAYEKDGVRTFAANLTSVMMGPAGKSLA
jgi:hypothetical protein